MEAHGAIWSEDHRKRQVNRFLQSPLATLSPDMYSDVNDKFIAGGYMSYLLRLYTR
jgi:hypothetical protein